ncbi:hypothetical protein BGZ65_003222 [Modicella reniformis]|uniref:Uncharacterized protein n=1 Tax=Modicella reniformis TaxID=1440133 RepID=A0A9P6JAB9_9FUNG|nr:hypothetical protein BGZ65_003222 [Modicella reniformis]
MPPPILASFTSQTSFSEPNNNNMSSRSLSASERPTSSTHELSDTIDDTQSISDHSEQKVKHVDSDLESDQGQQPEQHDDQEEEEEEESDMSGNDMRVMSPSYSSPAQVATGGDLDASPIPGSDHTTSFYQSTQSGSEGSTRELNDDTNDTQSISNHSDQMVQHFDSNSKSDQGQQPDQHDDQEEESEMSDNNMNPSYSSPAQVATDGDLDASPIPESDHVMFTHLLTTSRGSEGSTNELRDETNDTQSISDHSEQKVKHFDSDSELDQREQPCQHGQIDITDVDDQGQESEMFDNDNKIKRPSSSSLVQFAVLESTSDPSLTTRPSSLGFTNTTFTRPLPQSQRSRNPTERLNDEINDNDSTPKPANIDVRKDIPPLRKKLDELKAQLKYTEEERQKEDEIHQQRMEDTTEMCLRAQEGLFALQKKDQEQQCMIDELQVKKDDGSEKNKELNEKIKYLKEAKGQLSSWKAKLEEEIEMAKGEMLSNRMISEMRSRIKRKIKAQIEQDRFLQEEIPGLRRYIEDPEDFDLDSPNRIRIPNR